MRGALLEFGVGLAERTRELWDLGAAEDDQDHHEDDEELRDADIHTTRVASSQLPGYARRRGRTRIGRASPVAREGGARLNAGAVVRS